MKEFEKIKRLELLANERKKAVDRFTSKIENMLLLLTHPFDYFEKAATAIVKGLATLGDKIYKGARYATLPFSIIWYIQELIALRKKTSKQIPLAEIGAHYIYGKPGDGKSTFVYYFMERMAKDWGKGAYTTEQMEIPRFNDRGELVYHHQKIDLADIYKNGKQQLGFDGNRFDKLVIEETLTKFNHRNNKKTDYNDILLGIVETMATMRHQWLRQVIFISQLPIGDVQLMLMMLYHHHPKVKFSYGFRNWLKTGKLKKEIRGWRVEYSAVMPTGNNNYVFSKRPSYYVKNDLKEEMESFNRLNMERDYLNKKKITIRGEL